MQKMLVLLADVEPEAVNYLIMNADKYNTTGEDVCVILPAWEKKERKKKKEKKRVKRSINP